MARSPDTTAVASAGLLRAPAGAAQWARVGSVPRPAARAFARGGVTLCVAAAALAVNALAVQGQRGPTPDHDAPEPVSSPNHLVGGMPALVVVPDVLADLQSLAGALRHEAVRCLTGHTRNERTTVTGFVIPETEDAGPVSARFGRCPTGTVALWHNHPVPRRDGTEGVAAVRPQPIRRPRQLCALSRTDLRTGAELSMPFMVVAVDRDTWCWFDASQVARALERSMPQLPAPPRQLQEADPSGSSEPQGPFGR